MSRIRLRYTGLLIFGSKVASLFTGAAFVLLIARSFSAEVFGVWSFIGATIIYFLFFSEALPFWSMRELARGRDVGKTSVLGNVVAAIPFTMAYMAFSPYFASLVDSTLNIFLLSSLIIFLTYAIGGVNAIISARCPHKLAAYDIIIDVVKVAAFISLTWIAKINGLLSAITSLILAYFSYLCYALAVARKDIKGSFNSSSVKRWIKLSWLVIYRNLAWALFMASDRYILGALGFLKELGFYGAAISVANVVGSAGLLAFALYPKILSVGFKDRDVKDMLRLCLMFSIPMSIGCIAMSFPILWVIGSGERYIAGVTPLQILALAYLTYSTWSLPYAVIAGGEVVESYTHLKEILKSRLFTLHSLDYIITFISLPLIYTLSISYGIIGCSIAVFNGYLLFSIARFYLAFKGKKLRDLLPLTSFFKFLIASIAMAILITLLPQPRKLIQLFLTITLGALAYFTIIATIDTDSRNLVKATFKEITKSLTIS